MKKNLIKIIPLIVLAVSLIFSGIFVYQTEKGKLIRERERIKYVTDSQVNKLQYIINSLLQKTETLEMLVVEGEGKVKNFDFICEKLSDNTAIRSLQLAPNGVVTYVYPLEGNEEAYGDLFSDPERRVDAEYARDSGNMTLAGPYELSQGGFGAVARRPIYLHDKNGEQTFWGFSVIILNIPDAFYPAELDKFAAEGFSYKLHRIDSTTGEVQIIDESSTGILPNPIDISFEVPNGEWTFSVAPSDGWVSIPSVVMELGIALAVSVLIFLLAVAAVRLESQRERMSDLSMKDNLTGLNNQRTLMQTMNDFTSNSTAFGLLYLDFDGFKGINDTYGHAYGDLFLIEGAARLNNNFNGDSSVFRIGGDEFAIIIPKDLSPEFYQKMIEKINSIFAKPFEIEKYMLTASASVGYARYPEDAGSVEEMIRIADKAMYEVKNKRKCDKKFSAIEIENVKQLL